MEHLKLSEQDLKLFGELFSVCDTDNVGKITGPNASELFIKSGLSHEVLHEIIILCGAKRLGHFGRSQFYIALKLIAAVQNGWPIQLESISSGRDIPLPRFARLDADFTRKASLNQSYQMPQAQSTQRVVQPRSVYGFDQVPNSGIVNSPLAANNSVPADHQSPPMSPQGQTGATNNMLKHLPPGMGNHTTPGPAVTHAPNTPGQVGAASGFPGHPAPTNIQQRVLEKGWASFEDDSQGLISEEKNDWTRFTDSSKADTSSLSSETDSVDDVWLISDELRKYYLNQFITMQSDIKGVISGSVAKEFFEKSKLPISELSRIWQLADVNKDGALNLEEFNTAMHLVVCRINGVELPEQLPPSLMPYVPFANPDEPFASDLPPGSTLKRLTPSSPAQSQQQWQPSFAAQPSPSSSSVSSPGQKPTPVNFEFRPISEDQDSTIVHPVALRMSPDGQAFPIVDANGKVIPQQDPGGYNSQDLSPNEQLSPTAPQADQLVDIGQQQQSQQNSQVIHQPHPLQGRPRPTPKKAQSVPGPGQDGLHAPMFPAPPPSSQEPSAAAAVEAPVPPPRTKSHSRSNSLDANQVLNATEKVFLDDDGTVAPPVVPRRPKEGSTSTTEMSSSTLSAYVTSPCEEKRVTPQLSGDDLDAATCKVLPKQESQQKKDLRQRIKEQREKNLTLSRLNIELNSELQEVMEQRIGLEIQMEHLRPYCGGYL